MVLKARETQTHEWLTNDPDAQVNREPKMSMFHMFRKTGRKWRVQKTPGCPKIQGQCPWPHVRLLLRPPLSPGFFVVWPLMHIWNGLSMSACVLSSVQVWGSPEAQGGLRPGAPSKLWPEGCPCGSLTLEKEKRPPHHPVDIR